MAEPLEKRDTTIIRKYFKLAVITEKEAYELIYRIDDVFIYVFHSKLRSSYIILNQGAALPEEAKAITKQLYQRLILKYL